MTTRPLALLALLAVAWLAARGGAGEVQDAAPAPAAGELELGSGAHRYRWRDGWFERPAGEELGNTHGAIAVDAAGRIYVDTDTERAVLVYSPDGALLGSWGKELAGGLHGMCLVREGEREVLYLTHTGLHEWRKTTLGGETLLRVGWPQESGRYAAAEEFKPTAVAVAPDGRVFVADGYGLSMIHVYDADGTWRKCFATMGEAPGLTRSPHGLLIDARREPPTLLVADRENHRLQEFDLDGRHLGVIEGMLRRPCSIAERGGELVVADLEGRVTILDERNRLVAQLGDNENERQRGRNQVPRERWREGTFLAPHYACWDREGNLLVVDWNFLGRVTRLERLPDEAPARPRDGAGEEHEREEDGAEEGSR